MKIKISLVRIAPENCTDSHYCHYIKKCYTDSEASERVCCDFIIDIVGWHDDDLMTLLNNQTLNCLKYECERHVMQKDIIS